MKLTLHFFSKAEIELARVELSRGDQSPIVGVRGKSADFEADGCFQWTTAVKAFAELAVGARLAVAAGEAPYRLVGEQGSRAASLDYAISKPTQWIVDLFGSEQGGRPFAARVFQRHNTERKLPGPVSIQLVPSLNDPASLAIRLDGRELTERRELAELLGSLRGGEPAARRAAAGPGSGLPRDRIGEAMREELDRALGEVILMERMSIERAGERLGRLEWARESQTLRSVLRGLESETSARRGRYRDAAPEDLRSLASEEIEVSIVPLALGALALFEYLRRERGLRFRIDFAYAGSGEIGEEAHGARPGVRVLSWGAVSRMNGGAGALMLLPRTAFELVVPAGLEIGEVSEVFLADDPRGYPMQIFDALRSSGKLSGDARARGASLAEIRERLARRDGAAICAFPLSTMFALRSGGEAIALAAPEERVGDNVLVAESLPAGIAESLSSALRTAWFQLLESAERRAAVLKAICDDERYRTFLVRLGGLHGG